MRKKRFIILSAILIGVLMFCSFSKVQAVSSIFTGTELTRKNLEQFTLANNLSATNKVLGISKNRESGNAYTWNVTTTDAGKTVWKIAEYDTTSSLVPNYEKLYYCLNAERGFGLSNGSMAEGSKSEYNTAIDMKNMTNDNLRQMGIYIGGDLYESTNTYPDSKREKINKVLWILDHLYTYTGLENYQTSPAYKELMSNAEISIESDSKLNLTEDDIDVVQQMAIWHITNPSYLSNTSLPSLYINGEQLSSKYFYTDKYGTQITGAKRQEKAEKLYKYFIDNASETYVSKVPSLAINNSIAKIEELNDSYLVGPYTLGSVNADLITKITATVTPSEYTLLNGSKNEVSNNDFSKVINNNFYLKIPKSAMQTGNNNVSLRIDYTYKTRNLSLLTNATTYSETQPVVVVEEKTPINTISTNININLIDISVIKNWDDADNKDGVRPTSIKVQLYEDGVAKGNSIELNESNNWKYTWLKLIAGKTYKVRELNKDNFKIENNESLNDNYVATYNITENITTITNKHIPDVISKTVRKIWNDNNKDSARPTTIKIQLYANGKAYGDQITLTAGNDNVWQENELTYTWKELPLKEDGKEITYTVKELDENGNPLENEGKYNNKYVTTYSEDTFTITNTYKEFDLALRKFITEVDEEKYSREPKVDTSTISTTGTATYKHTKQPVAVQKGNVVTYTIRVYNEGKVDGYVNEITDHLPNNLIPIISGVDGIDKEKYKKEIEFNSDWLWEVTDNGNTIKTKITSKDTATDLPNIDKEEAKQNEARLLKAFKNGEKLDYVDVQIKCLVSDNVINNEYITNIAEITDAEDINGVKGDGNDSTLGNVDYSNLLDYRNEEALASNESTYIPGQEDDDDFEKLIIKEFDLALRKFITKVNDIAYSREPVVDTSKLGTKDENGKVITTARYIHSKEPVIVSTGDIVTYTIRIFNEGTLDGNATEIADDMPKGLEFLPDSSVNVEYKWKMIDKDGNETTDLSKANTLITDYLSGENNIIKAVTEKEGIKTLDYKDVQIQFKVTAKAEKLKDNIIKNVAQISADSDKDIDSIPNRNEKYNYDGENEDDIDYEPIKLQYFDLALRKFITKVNETDYNNRYPEIVYGDDGSITYKHTKDPVLVATTDTVIYTIRVYNEGEKPGYATEIKDDLPEGLEFLPENEINKKYKWSLIDKDGKETQDVKSAVKVTTDYLKDELLDALVVKEGQKVLSYKDVQIAFKVIEPTTSKRIVVNTAEISKDSDDDIDSTPDNNVITEDDIDKEYIKVQYFDLALKKWVTATRVTYNGKTTTTPTGFNEDTQAVAKVDLVSKKLSKTTVKFVYNIKVINEGEIAGYAYEVKDYIPKGLKFVAEDNKNWKEIKEGVVVTDQLKDKLLQPGESATVEIVLTWKNSSTNMGLKTNYAEISEDSGDDIDSTPDNYKLDEDDIDYAQVILSIKTSGTKTYALLVLISITVLAGGIFLIKKYVIK